MQIINEQNYVDQAEKVIKALIRVNPKSKKSELKITTSKIRNILTLTMNILNEVKEQRTEILPDSIVSQISYLRVRIMYEAGRDGDVRTFVEKGKLVEILQSIGNKKAEFLLFSRYIEALVAFHKYYRGRD